MVVLLEMERTKLLATNDEYKRMTRAQTEPREYVRKESRPMKTEVKNSALHYFSRRCAHYYAETGGAGSSAGWLYDTCNLRWAFWVTLPPRSSAFWSICAAQRYGIPFIFSYGVAFLAACFVCLVRGLLRYAEQECNHFIAFKSACSLLETMCSALRKLCSCKLGVKNKGNLIGVITSDIELLGVSTHTLSPICGCVLHCYGVVWRAAPTGFWVLCTVSYLVVGVLQFRLLCPKRSSKTAENKGLAGNLLVTMITCVVLTRFCSTTRALKCLRAPVSLLIS